MARASIDSTLAKIPLFKECTKKELHAVSRLVTPINVKAGKVLTKEGDAGREFMIIASGTASVRRKGRKIAALGPGDFFGELALLAGVPRTATVIAETDMVVEALNRAEFATCSTRARRSPARCCRPWPSAATTTTRSPST